MLELTSPARLHAASIPVLRFIAGLALALLFTAAASSQAAPARVRLGVDVLLSDRLDLIRSRRIGLITNPTGMTSGHESTIDALFRTPGVTLAALFGPEHGVRGAADAGESVDNAVDAATGVPVYSLYGRSKKPEPAVLAGLDLLIYDIQDIGSRAYTYIYTMALCMEAARDAGIPFIVLDRPNPLGGELIEGPVLDPRFKSFIGLYPIPYIYGMTVGELARLFNEEYGIHCNLTVVPMDGWRRSMRFEESGVMWVPTSPHIPYPMSVWYCAITGCIGELHQVNVGIGMPAPFEYIGAEWIRASELAAELNRRKIPGIFFRPVHYKPFYSNHEGLELEGVQIHILDRDVCRPMAAQIQILAALQQLYPGHNIYATSRIDMFNKAMGTDQVQAQILAGRTAADIIASWQTALTQFVALRAKYLIYPEARRL